jgi:hypothetical protein
MTRSCPRAYLGAVALLGLALAGCAGSPESLTPQPAPPPPAMPATIQSDEVVGRWGLAAYHKEADRPRTETQARNQCKNPYVITKGPSGGLMMHLADQPQPQELHLKGGPGGKNYVGPDGEAGGPGDREVVLFTGRVMVLRWMNQEVAGRYGTSVYVRCGARA